MVHVQRSNRRPPNWCHTADDRATFDSFEVFNPHIASRIEEPNLPSAFRVHSLNPVCLVAVAVWAGKEQIAFIRRAAVRFRKDVINFEQGTDHALGRETIAAAKPRDERNALANLGSDSRWVRVHSSGSNCFRSPTS